MSRVYYFFQGIVLFAVAIYVFYYVDSGTSKNVWLVILILIGLGSFGLAFEEPKGMSKYDTSKIPTYDTTIHKYVALGGELMNRQKSIEKMYLLGVKDINEKVFSNKLINKTSNEGLYTFKCIFNVCIYAKLQADGVILMPNFKKKKDLNDIQKIITGNAMSSGDSATSDNSKKLISPQKAQEITNKKALFMGPMRALSPKRLDNSKLNEYFADSLLLSLKGKEKSKRLDEVYDHYMSNTDYILKGLEL